MAFTNEEDNHKSYFFKENFYGHCRKLKIDKIYINWSDEGFCVVGENFECENIFNFSRILWDYFIQYFCEELKFTVIKILIVEKETNVCEFCEVL